MRHGPTRRVGDAQASTPRPSAARRSILPMPMTRNPERDRRPRNRDGTVRDGSTDRARHAARPTRGEGRRTGWPGSMPGPDAGPAGHTRCP